MYQFAKYYFILKSAFFSLNGFSQEKDLKISYVHMKAQFIKHVNKINFVSLFSFVLIRKLIYV